MKRLTINRRNAPLEKTSIEELPLPADRPAERHAHKIIMNIGGQRFEVTTNVEVREIRKDPAIVIEMPIRPRVGKYHHFSFSLDHNVALRCVGQ